MVSVVIGKLIRMHHGGHLGVKMLAGVHQTGLAECCLQHPAAAMSGLGLALGQCEVSGRYKFNKDTLGGHLGVEAEEGVCWGGLAEFCLCPWALATSGLGLVLRLHDISCCW
jgi:hypothetical protein